MKNKKRYSTRNILYSVSKNFKFPEKNLKKNLKKYTGLENVIQIEKNIINMPLFLSRLNIILNRYHIKGFTKNAYELLMFMTNRNCKKLLINLTKFAIKRDTNMYSKVEQWGRKHARKKKLLLTKRTIPTLIGYDKIIKRYIRFFSKNKEKIKHKNIKDITKIKITQTQIKINKKRSKINKYTENLSKTNKTLMTLLKGILQKRLHILRVATKCLFKYKPLELKPIVEKIEPVVTEKRKIRIKRVKEKQIKRMSDRDIWCTGRDCLKLIKFETPNKDFYFYYKWYLFLCNDYNSTINYEKGYKKKL